MATGYDELEEFTFAEVHYRATRDTANRISARVYATPEHASFVVANDVRESMGALHGATEADVRRAAREYVMAWRAYREVVAMVVAEETAK